MNKISIITVVFNAANTIEGTIKSVLNQDYPQIEYIIIDGGSTDGTVEIIEKYRKSVSYFISEPDDGLYYAMNKGLEVAKGDYVYFLNAGDTLVQGAIVNVAQYLELYPVDILYGNIVHNRYGRRLPLPLNAFYWQFPMSHQSIVLKRDSIDRFDTNYRLAADYKLFYEKYISGKIFLYLPIDIAFYEGDGLSDNLVNSCRERAMVSCEMLKRLSGFEEYDLYRRFILDFYLEKNFEIIMAGVDNTDILDEFANYYASKYSEIIVFGTGDIAGKCFEFLKRLGDRIVFFVDNDKNKWGRNFNGYRIASPDELINEKNKTVLIMNERFMENISQQLETMQLDATMTIDNYADLKADFKLKYKSEIIEKGLKEVRGFEVIADE